ncbi:MAG: dynamin family protein [Clostridiales Family XIII bacterium]|jgi:GTP-binding protein EngB required for normal cell division|nr:dynamin family protein [Clostridiales Family XIII bacterium]
MSETIQQLDAVQEKIGDIKIRCFVTSQSLSNHPMLKAKSKIRTNYCAVFEFFARACATNVEYVDARLVQYRKAFEVGQNAALLTDSTRDAVIRSVVNDAIRPWRRKYRYCLLCDLALVLLDEQLIAEAQKQICGYLSKRQIRLIESLGQIIMCDESPTSIPSIYAFVADLISQYHINREFVSLSEKRFMVTANVSAGKSTLINALIGKPVTRTSQEICTANLCYLYNKPFEDGAIHLLASPLNLSASREDLFQINKTAVGYIALFFQALAEIRERICIIDTPGVNSAINRSHGKMARHTLIEESYDKLIYVFNANHLGTEEEYRHLRFVAENVPKNKVIFVLNKLDDFKKEEDSIDASIEGVRNDLLRLGYENPTICPLSAYFALLIKMRKNGEVLTEDEMDEYEFCAKKFMKPEYDLSRYYDHFGRSHSNSDDFTVLAIKSGLYGFESILYGGMSENEKNIHKV